MGNVGQTDFLRIAPKQKLEELCRNVPEAPRLDRLLRYEASLERAFDRTLNQLERLQRIRLGLPVPQRWDYRLRCHRDELIAASRFQRI